MVRIPAAILFCLLGSLLAFAQSPDADNDGLPRDWEQFYSEPDLALAGDSTDDFDGDGIINLLEYVWGGDPTEPDAQIKPAVSIQENQYLISFNHRRSASSFLVEVEHTDALQSGAWTTNGFTEISRVNFDSDVERITYRLSNAVNESPRQFVRVSVRRAPENRLPPLFRDHLMDDTILGGERLTVGDMDGDQDQDVIASLSRTGSIYLYLNDGDGSSWNRIKVAPEKSIVAMQTTVADFDFDGDLDIAAVGLSDPSCPSCSTGKVVWHSNPGKSGGLWLEHAIAPKLSGARSLAAGFLYPEVGPDLVISMIGIDGNGGGLYWVRNMHRGTSWSELLPLDPNLRQAEEVIVRDVNHDYAQDVIALSKTDNLIVWYESDLVANTVPRTPKFTRHVIANITAPDSFYLANIDDDYQTELIVSSSAGIEVLDSGPDPRQPWARRPVDSIFGTGRLSRLFGADFDGDGRVDIAGASNERQELRWYKNIPGGTCEAQTIRTDYTGLVDLVPGDFNRDGRLDILTSTSNHDGADQIAWWENTRSGAPANRPPVIIVPPEQTVKAGNTLNVQIRATDPDNDPLTFSLPRPWAGVTINPTTGIISWRTGPELICGGECTVWYHIGVAVTDGAVITEGLLIVRVTP